MKHLTSKEKNLSAFWIAMVLAFAVAGYTLGAITGPKYPFYDGEGNTMPYRAVDSLVHSQFMDKDFSKAGRDTVYKYFPSGWRGIISERQTWEGTPQYVALIINDSLQDYTFIKPHEGRFGGDTSLLQVLSCLDAYQVTVSTKDSAEMAIDRWKKIYNRK